MKTKSIKITTYLLFLLIAGTGTVIAQVTKVSVTIPRALITVNPMIYGQMLENVNDSMIYGGVADLKGDVRQHLVPHLRDLKIPVMRWPGGTVVHEYHWENGIGSRDRRPTVPNLEWGGIENYQFGTDEFLQWCEEIGTRAYINFNMGNHAQYKGTLGEALAWIQYVNGGSETPYGKLRAANGRAKPYNVQYWGLGNENYLTSKGGGHVKEPAALYTAKLKQWAGTIRTYHPDLQLLGIGNTLEWNQTVLEECGQYVDFLTQHYYVNAKVQDGKIQNPVSTLFAPAKMEAHLALLGEQLTTMNKQLGRADKPIRLSVDEWNNRHSVNNGNEFTFTRHDPRRQFDVAVIAGMLNAFIRQSPHVGMANYIFPVNAHGLIHTVGNTDAYQTPAYYVFKQYREQLTGSKLEVNLKGPSIATTMINPTIAGDSGEAAFTVDSLTYVDAAAVLNRDKAILLSLVNRSPDKPQKISIDIPEGYTSESIWMLANADINADNNVENRARISPVTKAIKTNGSKVNTKIPPCGLYIVKLTLKP